MNEIDPLSRKISKSRKVLFGGEPSRIEAAHLAWRCSAAMSGLAADDPAHRRIVAQTFGVVHVLVSGEPPEHGLPQQPDQRMATVPAGAGVSGRAACHHAEAEDVTTEPRNWSVNQLIKIGAKVVSRGRYITFQMAEVAVPRQMFADILSLIARLHAPPAPA